MGDQVWTLTLTALPFVLVAGFLIAAVCGYMAGLLGSSNSPISSVGILTVVSCAGLLLLVAAPGPPQPLIAFALIVTAGGVRGATISNDNLQDLKTGQLVGAAAVAPAGGAAGRGWGRRGGDPAGAQPPGACLWLRRRAARDGACAGRAAGDADSRRWRKA